VNPTLKKSADVPAMRMLSAVTLRTTTGQARPVDDQFRRRCKGGVLLTALGAEETQVEASF